MRAIKILCCMLVVALCVACSNTAHGVSRDFKKAVDTVSETAQSTKKKIMK